MTERFGHSDLIGASGGAERFLGLKPRPFERAEVDAPH